MRALSGGGLPLVGLATTWASFDWTMSLQPEWYSTVFGLYFFAGAFVGAIALVSVMMNVSRLWGPSPLPMTPDHAQALGRLLFAMVIFWAYMAFSQLLIYWIADIPKEVTFYARRMTGSWTAVTYVLVFGNFVVPFFALLNRRWKRHPNYLAVVAAWVLVVHFVDVYWLVLPVYDREGARPSWLDLGAILFVGGLSGAWIARRYLDAPPVPLHDPELAEGLGYEAAV
jgi:NADH:ubiquinone oxidoreductase subunit 6 (subunit J)